MKKILVIFLSFLSIYGLNAQDQKEKKDFSHWSMTLEAGLNRFDGDVIQPYNDLTPNAMNKISFGGSIEYTLTPVWSMGAAYYYLPLRADIGKIDYSGKMQSVDYFNSFNLIKAFYKKSRSKWGLWFNAGVGYSWYNSLYYTAAAGTRVYDGHHNAYLDFNDTIKDGRVWDFPIGILLEYNFTKNIAVGTKLQYRPFSNDYIEQRIQHGVTNDAIELATLQLRWKFNAQKKDHTRNISVDDFNGEPIIPKNFQPAIDSLKSEIGKLKPALKALDEIQPLKKRVEALENQPKPTAYTYVPQQGVKYNFDDPDVVLMPGKDDDDDDGVPNNRDKEPNTAYDTPVDFWGRTIPAYDVNGAAVYFDFDRTELDREAQDAIRYAATKLKSDPTLLVEIRGFCDYMGSFDYNEGLSQRRADKVKNELVRVYRINPDRIVANGRGKLLNPKTRFRGNRRCNFFYSK